MPSLIKRAALIESLYPFLLGSAGFAILRHENHIG